MKKRISMTLCICLLAGAVLGCGAEVSEPASSVTVSENLETQNDFTEDESTADSEENYSTETVNASGLPPREGAALVVTVARCDYSHASNKVRNRITEEYEFDSEGRRLRYTCYGLSSEAFEKRIEYEYDADNNLIRKTCYDLEEDGGAMNEWTEYQYVKKDSGNLRTHMEFEYNAEGNLLRESGYDTDGRLINETSYRQDGDGYEYGLARKYEYDSSENLSRTIYYDVQGNATGWREEVYDDAGNLTLCADYDEEGNIDIYEGYDCDTYMYIYQYWPSKNEYDETGNLIKRTGYDYEGNVIEIAEYTYDNANRLIKDWHYFSDHNYTEEIIYEYDNAGNQVKEYIDQQIIWEKEYDDRNRLVKYAQYSYGKECWYEYEYKTIGVAEENYPFDRIKVAEYLYR